MNWPIKPIGQIVKVVGGGTPTRDNSTYYGGSIPWVTPKDMKFWQIDGAQISLTQTGLDNSAAKLINTNAVLIVVRSGVLKHSLPVGINRVPVAINQDMKALICGDEVDCDYLARFIQGSSPTILQWVRATTADNFPIDLLKELKVPLPPLPEQRRIADILDRADALRAKRRAAIVHLDELTQAIFIDMFGDPAKHGWPMVKIADIVDGNHGGIRTGPFGSQLLHSEFVDSGIAVLGIDNAVANEFGWSERRYITLQKYADLRRYTVFPGDVLITIMGTCGRCAVVPEDIPTAINTKHLCCITTDRTKCLPDFLHTYFLQHPIARDYLARTAKGAIMDGLNMGLIKDMPIPIVPVATQSVFVDRLIKLQQQRQRTRDWLNGADALFASLQDRAFRGAL